MNAHPPLPSPQQRDLVYSLCTALAKALIPALKAETAFTLTEEHVWMFETMANGTLEVARRAPTAGQRVLVAQQVMRDVDEAIRSGHAELRRAAAAAPGGGDPNAALHPSKRPRLAVGVTSANNTLVAVWNIMRGAGGC